MILNLDEWQQVENMRSFKNCRSEVILFSNQLALIYYYTEFYIIMGN